MKYFNKHLTTTEMKILTLLNDGKSNKEIAQILNISVHTVNSYAEKIINIFQGNNLYN